jgi:hypothetical protein
MFLPAQGLDTACMSGQCDPRVQEGIMPHTRQRGLFLTIFGVIGSLHFGFLALEYSLARYATLASLLPLPAPWGLAGFFDGIPQWGSIALTLTIWLGLLGSVLLLLRERASVLVLTFAFLSSLLVLVWGAMAFIDGHVLIDTVRPLDMGAGLACICFGLWLYARTAKRNGVLS